MIIKRDIPEVFRGTISDDITSAKEFIVEIEKRFAKSENKYSYSELNFHEVSRQRKCHGHYGNVKYCFKIKGTKA